MTLEEHRYDLLAAQVCEQLVSAPVGSTTMISVRLVGDW